MELELEMFKKGKGMVIEGVRERWELMKEELQRMSVPKSWEEFGRIVWSLFGLLLGLSFAGLIGYVMFLRLFLEVG